MILEMHDVHVNLGLSHVLQGVNLSVHPGETVGLFGRNGVGKTTIFKTIAGWYRPDRHCGGRAGYPPHRARERQGAGQHM